MSYAPPHHHHTLPTVHHHHHHRPSGPQQQQQTTVAAGQSLYGRPPQGGSAGRHHGQRGGPVPIPPEELSSLPSLDATSSYTPFDSPYNPISPEDLNDESTLIRLLAPTASASAPEGNRGHKLERGARWVRKGKAVAWGMSVGEREAEDRLRARLKLTLSHHLPPNSPPADHAALPSTTGSGSAVTPLAPTSTTAFGATPAEGNIATETKPTTTTRTRSISPPLLPHLRSPSPLALSSASLSHLLSPPRSYTELVTSPAMQHTFASSHLEDALGHTAGELIEGETGLLKALGRFFEECRERGVGRRATDDDDFDGPAAKRAKTSTIMAEAPSLQQKGSDPMAVAASSVSTAVGGLDGIASSSLTSLFKSEPSDGATAASPSSSLLLGAAPSNPHKRPSVGGLPAASLPPPPPGPELSLLERLFITPSGVTYPVLPPSATGTPAAAGSGGPPSIHMNVELQKETLYRGMDALGELLADSREYVERLEEVRERLAGVGRGRRRVWREIRERVVERGELNIRD